MPTLSRVPGGFQVRFKKPWMACVHLASDRYSLVEIAFPVWTWRGLYFRVRSREIRRANPNSWRWMCEIHKFAPYHDPGPGVS